MRLRESKSQLQFFRSSPVPLSPFTVMHSSSNWEISVLSSQDLSLYKKAEDYTKGVAVSLSSWWSSWARVERRKPSDVFARSYSWAEQDIRYRGPKDWRLQFNREYNVHKRWGCNLRDTEMIALVLQREKIVCVAGERAKVAFEI